LQSGLQPESGGHFMLFDFLKKSLFFDEVGLLGDSNGACPIVSVRKPKPHLATLIFK
jgi:hypothetical protein